MRSSKHARGVPLVLLALALSLVFALAVLPSRGKTDTVDTDGSVNVSQDLSYDFRVHALNCTYQAPTQTGTLFRFDTTDLPFEFSTVSFCDYRTDTSFSHKYYAGSGILVNANGTNATITLRESTGRLVSRIDYHGQPQVVFNGKIESVTYPKNATTYEGTDQMIQDWRNETWTPDDGIVVEHPNNVTMSGASFFLMTLEPMVTTEVPEFESLLPVVAVLSILLLLRRRICTVKE
jgi:hypothetical protein